MDLLPTTPEMSPAEKAEKLEAIGNFLSDENINFFHSLTKQGYKADKVNKKLAGKHKFLRGYLK